MNKPAAGQSPGMQSITSQQPTEVLAGSIERVTFHSAESGFCVLRIKARGHRDLVTVVGHAAEISAGEWVTVAELRKRPFYSPQIRVFERLAVPGRGRG